MKIAVGIVLLTACPFGAARAEDNTADWVQVTPKAQWQPRDSSGEVVFRDRLWLFGGWFTSFVGTPRDVWSSADGRDWTRVTEQAAWKHGDLPMSLVFDDKMWFMGGWHNGRLPGHSASNEVWSSSDGVHWSRETAAAPWNPRLWFSSVVYRDAIWVLGGWSNNPFRNWVTFPPKIGPGRVRESYRAEGPERALSVGTETSCSTSSCVS